MDDKPKPIGKVPSRVPSRTPSRVPTRGGKGPARKGPAREPLPPGTLLKGGAYRILEPIGEGGFSVTYVAQEGQRRVMVAVKELFPLGCLRHGFRVIPANHWDALSFAEALQDFVREGLLLKGFNHPAIVRSYAPFEENGTAYLAMELLQGESLLLGLQRRGLMNQSQSLDVARQIGSALQQIHESSMLHSDIKPENIIRTDDGRYVVLDFGVSKRYQTARTNTSDIVVVSPGYSPPEQYLGSSSLTPAADIYSLAATLYILLGMTMLPDAMKRQAGARLQPLTSLNSSVTAHYWQAIEQALHLNPAQRPQTVEDFLALLERAEGGGSSGAGGPTPQAGAVHLKKVVEFKAHRDPISFVQLHPHQPLLLSGSKSGSIRLWHWPMGHPVGFLKAHDTALCGLALSPDGRLLATAGEPGEVKLWAMETGTLIRVVRSGIPAVHGLAFSPDGQTLAVALADGTIQFFSPQAAQPSVLITGHIGAVSCVCFSPDGMTMASSGHDGLIVLWEVATQRQLGTLEGHSKAIMHLRFSRDGNLLASSSGDFSARVWDYRAGLELRRYRELGASVWGCDFTCNADVLVSANADKKLRFLRMSSGREAAAVEADRHYVRAVVCDAREPLLASGGSDGHIRIWQFLAT